MRRDSTLPRPLQLSVMMSEQQQARLRRQESMLLGGEASLFTKAHVRTCTRLRKLVSDAALDEAQPCDHRKYG